MQLCYYEKCHEEHEVPQLSFDVINIAKGLLRNAMYKHCEDLCLRLSFKILQMFIINLYLVVTSHCISDWDDENVIVCVYVC